MSNSTSFSKIPVFQRRRFQPRPPSEIGATRLLFHFFTSFNRFGSIGYPHTVKTECLFRCDCHYLFDSNAST